MKFGECKMMTSVSPIDKGVKIYCEDQRLSMNRVGMTYAALQIEPSEIIQLTPKEVEYIVDMCGSFLNIEGDGNLQPAQKKARWSLLRSPVTMDARKTLLNVLTGRAAAATADAQMPQA